MAIEEGVLLAYAPSSHQEVRMCSLDFPGEVRFDLDDWGPVRPGDWGNYVRGAVFVLRQAGHDLHRGLVGIIAGQSWAVGGLSSSAAAGVAYLLALEETNGLVVKSTENVLLDQAIENDYLELNNGILDQAAVLFSRKDQLTLIDCANITYSLTASGPAMPEWNIIIASSGLKKALVGTDYNRRVAECTEAARILLQAADREVAEPLLGHVRDEEYFEYKNKLSGAVARRAEHFFQEVQRVRDGVEAWKAGNLHEFGRLMTASGESSIHNYECGSPPLVDLYHILVKADGVYGGRFSGAGFRGCCVGLIAREAAGKVIDEIKNAYARHQPDFTADAAVIVCHSGDGAKVWNLE